DGRFDELHRCDIAGHDEGGLAGGIEHRQLVRGRRRHVVTIARPDTNTACTSPTRSFRGVGNPAAARTCANSGPSLNASAIARVGQVSITVSPPSCTTHA